MISIDLNNLENEPTTLLTLIPTNRGSPVCIEAYMFDAERISIGGQKYIIDINVYLNVVISEILFSYDIVDLIYLKYSTTYIAVGQQ